MKDIITGLDIMLKANIWSQRIQREIGGFGVKGKVAALEKEQKDRQEKVKRRSNVKPAG